MTRKVPHRSTTRLGLRWALLVSCLISAPAFGQEKRSVEARDLARAAEPRERIPFDDSGDTVFLDAEAFGETVILEILPFGERTQHRNALSYGLAEINEMQALLDPDGDAELGLGALNRAAGGKAVTLDPRVIASLARALEYCEWSQNALGPLGGNLNGLWGLVTPVYGLPNEAMLGQQTALASCQNLSVDMGTNEALIPLGVRADLRGFARGLAVDRAVSVLGVHGAQNGWVSIGTITRAFGEGRKGRGWPMRAQPMPGEEHRIRLEDSSLAMISGHQKQIEIADEPFPPWVSQRTGRPGSPNRVVLVATELAVDAEALAVSLFLVSSREGQYRLGSIRPQPAVLWLEGDGTASPLMQERGWAALKKW